MKDNAVKFDVIFYFGVAACIYLSLFYFLFYFVARHFIYYLSHNSVTVFLCVRLEEKLLFILLLLLDCKNLSGELERAPLKLRKTLKFLAFNAFEYLDVGSFANPMDVYNVLLFLFYHTGKWCRVQFFLLLISSILFIIEK